METVVTTNETTCEQAAGKKLVDKPLFAAAVAVSPSSS